MKDAELLAIATNVHSGSSGREVASKRVKLNAAIVNLVETAVALPSLAKASAFVQSLELVAPEADAPRPALHPPLKLEDANARLLTLGWRRCKTREKSGKKFFMHDNLENDTFHVLQVPRDGNCLFHCFARFLLESRLDTGQCTDKIMREEVAQHLEDNNGTINCDLGNGVTLPFTCEDIQAIRSGEGGRRAYGDLPEIAAFCQLHDVCATVFAPESECLGSPPVILNPQGTSKCMFLSTLAWGTAGKRTPGQDHWQLLEKREGGSDIVQEQAQPVQQPLLWGAEESGRKQQRCSVPLPPPHHPPWPQQVQGQGQLQQQRESSQQRTSWAAEALLLRWRRHCLGAQGSPAAAPALAMHCCC
jgi:hypothetical protein